ncbi:MAG: CoA transferase [Hyphomicrobiaceae bacterium]|jgi:crotonobetainyl-CoA:carnitine CoA-transferase CaiB-like acyl-CoA transferase
MSEQPLSGINVVDLTRVLSGPFCTMLLADMGADVIKIEPPGSGDTVRGAGDVKAGMSWYFASFNRNKRSLAIDLRSPQGRRVLDRLISKADVLVENFRPGVLGEMGLTQARLDELNPKLIVASINGYGSTGPYVERPAFDFIAQAMSGLMSTTGAPGSEPMRAAPPLTDLIAGLYCAFGIVNALHARQKSGRGQRVEAAMVNGMVSMLAYLASEYFAKGKEPERTGNDHPICAPYSLFRAKDGDIAVAPATNETLQRFMRTIGLSEMLERAEYKTNAQRHTKRHELRGPINERLATDTQDNWIERLNAAGVPCGKVLSVGEVFDDPQIKAQDMVLDVDHGPFGSIRMVGFPVKLSETPCAIRRPAPDLGQHTEEVLKGLGLSDTEIGELKATKIVV